MSSGGSAYGFNSEIDEVTDMGFLVGSSEGSKYVNIDGLLYIISRVK